MKVADFISKKQRSHIVKQAKAGHDFGKGNKKGKTGFANVVNKAEKEGYSANSAKKIAGAQFWKQQGKKK